MKMVVAIIKPFKVEEVREALCAAGVHGVTITEVLGFGQQNIYEKKNTDLDSDIFGLPKVRLETAISSDILDQVLKAIENSAYTGKIGDGKIIVYDLEQVLRIRTGETGEDAL